MPQFVWCGTTIMEAWMESREDETNGTESSFSECIREKKETFSAIIAIR